MKTISIAFLGAGRMGQTHLRNLVGIGGVHVSVVADLNEALAQAGAELVRADRWSTDTLGSINASDVDAVLIATSTASHAQLIEAVVAAGKPVWCEKPVSGGLEDTQRVVNSVRASSQPAMIGFMRRFDPGYARARQLIDHGELGRIERFRALSCDHTPPPLSFIKTSGGIFVDMLVHDIDMARWLVGEIEEVHAWGAALVDPGYAAVGDVDSVTALLRFKNGAIGTLEGSRRTTWGYDIRTEVAGSAAKVVVEARNKTPFSIARNVGHEGDFFNSFPDRFEAAYKAELSYFFDCIRTGAVVSPTVEDALESLRVAIAATISLREQRPVRVDEV